MPEFDWADAICSVIVFSLSHDANVSVLLMRFKFVCIRRRPGIIEALKFYPQNQSCTSVILNAGRIFRSEVLQNSKIFSLTCLTLLLSLRHTQCGKVGLCLPLSNAPSQKWLGSFPRRRCWLWPFGLGAEKESESETTRIREQDEILLLGARE